MFHLHLHHINLSGYFWILLVLFPRDAVKLLYYGHPHILMGNIKTGIPGFDDILKGGLPEHAALLVSGVPGVGKTIMALQYIYEGLKNGEPCMFISCEIDEQSILTYAASFGLDIAHYTNDLLTIVYEPITGKVVTLGTIMNTILKRQIKRVALDSLTLFQYLETSDIAFRKQISDFISNMKSNGITLVVTSEREIGQLDNIVYRPEDFLFDGLVFMIKIRKGSTYERCITIAKLRSQEHLTGIYPFTIQHGGITIFPAQIPFSLIEQQ